MGTVKVGQIILYNNQRWVVEKVIPGAFYVDFTATIRESVTGRVIEIDDGSDYQILNEEQTNE